VGVRERVTLVVVCFPDCQFLNIFFTHVLVFILLFLSLLCNCFKVMICMYVCYMLFNKYSILNTKILNTHVVVYIAYYCSVCCLVHICILSISTVYFR